MVQNSSFSYRQLCGDNGLMVIVPHEDDEINLADYLWCAKGRSPC